jgi:hypothetical protein
MLIRLALFCIIILLSGILYSREWSANMSHLIGNSLGKAFGAWLLYFLIFRNKIKIVQREHACAFFSFLACALVGGYVAHERQISEASKMVDEFHKMYDEIVEDFDSGEVQSDGATKFDSSELKSTGDFGELERWVKEIYLETEKLQAGYMIELENIGWDRILDANRLAEDKTFLESQDILLKAIKGVDKYRQDTMLLMENAEKRIEQLNFSENAKGDMRNSFENGLASGLKLFTELIDLEKAVVLEVEKMIQLLTDARGSWEAAPDGIMFNEHSDMNAYNGHLKTIEEIVEQQSEIQQMSMSKLNNRLEVLDEALGR